MGSFISTRDSFLVDDSLEKAGNHTSDEWADQVDWHVHHGHWVCFWVGVTVEQSLENGLNKAYSWVDATTGNTRSDSDGSIQGETYGDTVHWHVLRTILLDDLKDKGNEEASHDSLNEEDLANQLSTIIAAVSWAQLGDVVGSWHWKYLVILWEPDHGGGAAEASEDSSEELEEHDDLTEDDAESGIIVSMLDHHTNCYCRIEMPTTDCSEHLGHDGNCESDTDWGMG